MPDPLDTGYRICADWVLAPYLMIFAGSCLPSSLELFSQFSVNSHLYWCRGELALDMCCPLLWDFDFLADFSAFSGDAFDVVVIRFAEKTARTRE
jgi:hypothetical protein